jgi:AcrR family transcriptional regulator
MKNQIPEENQLVSVEPKMGLREQRKAETREKIVKAAIECFSEHGFNGASTRDIAKAAGVGQGLITYHFDSKETLWKAAVTELYDNIPVAPEFDPDSITSAEQARDMLFEYARLYAEHCLLENNTAMFLFHQASQPDEKLTWLLDTHFTPSLEQLRPFYEVAIKLKAIKPIPFSDFAFAFIGIINTQFALHGVYRHLTGKDPQQKDVAEQMLNTMIELFT